MSSRARCGSGHAGLASAVVSAFLALASAACWGTSDFFAGLFTRRLPVAAVVGWSQSLTFVVLSLVVAFAPIPFGSGQWLAWSVGASAAGIVGLLCFYSALAGGTMGVVAPIASLGVVVPVVLGVLLGEQPAPWAWVGMLVAVVGVTLASGPELQGAVSPRPVLLASGAAVAFGLTLFLIDRGARVSPILTGWGMRAFALVVFAVLALLTRSTGGVGRRDLLPLTLIGCGDVTANILFGAASALGQVSVASVLGSLYPVATITLARVVLGERLRRIQHAGVALALVGGAVVGLSA